MPIALLASIRRSVVASVDSHSTDVTAGLTPAQARKIDVFRAVPFMLIHLACIAIIWVGISWWAVGLALGLFWLRMFGITGAYHRYFSHRTYRTSRVMQFLLAVLGNSSVQRGPLWWAAHHRKHHRYSDQPEDAHSPKQDGFWWSHCLWFLSRQHYCTDLKSVPDLAKFPELMFLDRFDWFVPMLLGVSCFTLGGVLAAAGADTSSWQLFIWGFCVSTVMTAHGTFTINSLAHVWGKRVFPTEDTSRNNFWLALLTLGEGWHNNHHHYQSSARNGFRWYEIDITWYVLWSMERVGLVWDCKRVPETVMDERRRLLTKDPLTRTATAS